MGSRQSRGQAFSASNGFGEHREGMSNALTRRFLHNAIIVEIRLLRLPRSQAWERRVVTTTAPTPDSLVPSSLLRAVLDHQELDDHVQQRHC
jgi:hypothetical protein